jgi:hypothetical protein
MKRTILLLLLVFVFATLSWGGTITPIQSYTPVLTGGTVANFEGFSEFARISSQYSGMTFSQTGGGLPMIDNYNENLGGMGCSGLGWCYGYGASSGSGVLTGSPDGGNIVTTAGIIINFATPQFGVQAFLSDTSPLGDYTVSAFNSTHLLLGTLTVLNGTGLPPGYNGGFFPPPGTFPLPGIYVGFEDTVAEISSIQIGPSSAGGDAFAVDDVRFGSTTPEPGTITLVLSGVGAGVGMLRRRKLI